MLYKWLYKIRQTVMTRLTVGFYYPFLYWVYKPAHNGFAVSDLTAMPAGSAGYSLLSFWADNKISKIRNYELHDVKHLLLGYTINYEGEISMQYFEWGNGNRSLPVLVAIVVGTAFAPEFAGKYIAAYRRGKTCRPINDEYLLQNITTDLQTLKKQLQK